jgi:hypothetical protein
MNEFYAINAIYEFYAINASAISLPRVKLRNDEHSKEHKICSARPGESQWRRYWHPSTLDPRP